MVKLPKKIEQTSVSVSGVKLLTPDHDKLALYVELYKEQHGIAIELGEAVSMMAVAFMDGDTDFKKVAKQRGLV